MQPCRRLARIGKPSLELPFRHCVALLLVLFKRRFESSRIHRVAALRRQLFGQFERKTVRIVQFERLFSADGTLFHVIRILFGHEFVFALDAVYALFEFLDALFQRRFEAFDLAGKFLQNVLFLLGQERIRLVIHLFDKYFRGVQKFLALDAQRSRVTHRAAASVCAEYSPRPCSRARCRSRRR